ncbi:MAG: lytic transglycosylase, partial [Leptothrix ochracea]
MTEAQLCEVNVIPPRMLIKAGSTLLVARDAQRSDDNVSEHLADNAFMHLMPEAGGGRRHAAHKTSGRTRSAHLRDKRQTASAARSAKNARAHASTPVTRQLATKN